MVKLRGTDWVMIAAGTLAAYIISFFTYTNILADDSVKISNLANPLNAQPCKMLVQESKHELTEVELETVVDERSADEADEVFLEIPAVSYTDEVLLVALLYHECRGESIECQKWVCSVILNRFATGEYESIHDVIYAPGQFSTAKLINTTDLNQASTQFEVVEDVLEHGTVLPYHVIYFRSKHYHTMSDAEDYNYKDNTYFSSSKKLKKRYGVE